MLIVGPIPRSWALAPRAGQAKTGPDGGDQAEEQRNRFRRDVFLLFPNA